MQLGFRHSCKTKFIGGLNQRLSSEQKRYIKNNVFGWLLWLPKSIKIIRNLLSKLCGRWVNNMDGFILGTKC